jgi:hypothetical protein
MIGLATPPPTVVLSGAALAGYQPGKPQLRLRPPDPPTPSGWAAAGPGTAPWPSGSRRT